LNWNGKAHVLQHALFSFPKAMFLLSYPLPGATYSACMIHDPVDVDPAGQVGAIDGGAIAVEFCLLHVSALGIAQDENRLLGLPGTQDRCSRYTRIGIKVAYGCGVFFQGKWAAVQLRCPSVVKLPMKADPGHKEPAIRGRY